MFAIPSNKRGTNRIFLAVIIVHSFSNKQRKQHGVFRVHDEACKKTGYHDEGKAYMPGNSLCPFWDG